MVLLPFRHSVIGFSKLLYAFIDTHFWSFTCSLALIWLRWPGSFINNSYLIISSLCTLCQSVSQSASNGTSGVFHCLLHIIVFCVSVESCSACFTTYVLFQPLSLGGPLLGQSMWDLFVLGGRQIRSFIIWAEIETKPAIAKSSSCPCNISIMSSKSTAVLSEEESQRKPRA